MTRQNVFNALMDFDPFMNTIGYERMFDRLNRIAADTVQPQKYPPYNIVKQSDDIFDIELAVAGFSEDDINITVTDGIISIEGSKVTKIDEKDTDKYIHRGIGTRSFTRKFSLSDTLEVKGAAMENGMLVIRLENIVPDHKKPKQIAIETGTKSLGSGSKPEFLTETSEVQNE